MSGEASFQVQAHNAVPAGVSDRALRNALEALANERMVDIEDEG